MFSFFDMVIQYLLIKIKVLLTENLIDSSVQVKTPIVNANSKVLVPGLPGHQASVKGSTQAPEKRKKEVDTKEVGSVLLTMQHAASLFLILMDYNWHESDIM